MAVYAIRIYMAIRLSIGNELLQDGVDISS